jgi:hypothetical protein
VQSSPVHFLFTISAHPLCYLVCLGSFDSVPSSLLSNQTDFLGRAFGVWSSCRQFRNGWNGRSEDRTTIIPLSALLAFVTRVIQATCRHLPLGRFVVNGSTIHSELAVQFSFRFVVGSADHTIALIRAIQARFAHFEALASLMIVHEEATLHVLNTRKNGIVCQRSRRCRNHWDIGGREDRFTIIPLSPLLIICAGVIQITFRHPPLVRFSNNGSAADTEFAIGIRFFIRFLAGCTDYTVARILAGQGRFIHFKALVLPVIVHKETSLHIFNTSEYGIIRKRCRFFLHFVSIRSVPLRHFKNRARDCEELGRWVVNSRAIVPLEADSKALLQSLILKRFESRKLIASVGSQQVSD